VLPIDPPAKEGVVPGVALGPVKVRPYGFIKDTMTYDTYYPTSDDFPRPGFTNPDSGPTSNPEFHIKARATRWFWVRVARCLREVDDHRHDRS